MTNDNKTLADVQPGGRVRLGDQASAQGCDELRMRTDGERAAYLEGVAEGRRAVLSAQPSPGGQGDAVLRAINSKDLYQVLMDVQNGIDSPALAGMANGAIQLIDKARSALAARQPVEFERAIPTRRRESAVELLLQLGFVWNNQRWEDRRQPVGEIDEAAVLRRAAAVLYMWEDDPNLTGYMGDFKDACGILELLAQHAAPTAQAVDLERFRGTVKSQYSMTEWMHRCGFVSAEKLEESKKNHDHLMALIDSQAVGK